MLSPPQLLVTKVIMIINGLHSELSIWNELGKVEKFPFGKFGKKKKKKKKILTVLPSNE